MIEANADFETNSENENIADTKNSVKKKNLNWKQK